MGLFVSFVLSPLFVLVLGSGAHLAAHLLVADRLLAVEVVLAAVLDHVEGLKMRCAKLQNGESVYSQMFAFKVAKL